MSYLGSWKIDDVVTFTVTTHRFDTGAATDADSAPAYRVYEDETATPIVTGTMALLDSANTAGFYSEQITLSAANGFEKGKSYNIYVSAAVNSVTGVTSHSLQIEAEVDANAVSPTVVNANVTQISGDATAADNAEAFFDGTGYAGTGNVIPTVTDVTTKTGYRLSATGVDDIWDEATSGHNTSGTFGQAMFPIRAGTAQAGGASTITLDGSASASNDFYNNTIIHITGGTGANQSNIISDYVGATKVATVSTAWVTQPSSDSVFVISRFGAVPGATAPTAGEVADAVWDEDIVAAHSTSDTAGLVLSELTKRSVTFSTAVVAGSALRQVVDDGTATFDRTTDSLQAIRDASATVANVADAIWDEARSGHTTDGTFGQAAQVIRSGTAQAGAAGSITLDASASSSDDFYNNAVIQITAGTGANQSRIISDYVGSTKVASVNGNWVTNPSSDSVFVIRPFGAVPGASAPTSAEVADAVWDEARSGHTTAGSFGEGAASVQGNVTGSVASVTARVTANTDQWNGVAVTTPPAVNVTQVSGDATAADNLEAALDGTGGVTLSAAIAGNITGNLSGSVGSVTGDVTGNLGGNVTGSVASVTNAVTGGGEMRKNVAGQKYPVYLVDSSGDPVTGATVTVKISKDGAAPATITGSVAEIDATDLPGWYLISFSQGDTNADLLVGRATAVGAVPRPFYFTTAP